MLQNHTSEGAYIFERDRVPAASAGFSVGAAAGLNLERLILWTLSNEMGEKEARVWL